MLDCGEPLSCFRVLSPKTQDEKMNPDVKSIVAAATALYGKIARAYDNLMKLGMHKITLEAVEARLQALDRNWAKFRTMRWRIRPPS